MDADLVLFLALSSFAIAIAGATAFVIFWPLALVHIRDRHPPITAQLGEGAFLTPRALWWLLHGDYRAAQDPYLSGLATPSRVSLLVILGGIAMGAILALIASIGPRLRRSRQMRQLQDTVAAQGSRIHSLEAQLHQAQTPAKESSSFLSEL